MAVPSTLHLFCRVVDNFGDIGVCWRLARQLQSEHGLAVTLWVDDLHSFQRICAAVNPMRMLQSVSGVSIRHWSVPFISVAPDEVADVVIEAFACELPAQYLAAMAACEHPPAWINLEYLSAEPWVEGCHAMASRHPSLPLTKYFFFPGFSNRTGGLIVETDLRERCEQFRQSPACATAFLAGLGIVVPKDACLVSLFCYPSAPVSQLLEAMRRGSRKVMCLVPHGVAVDAVTDFLQQPAEVGAVITREALTLQVLPFVDQPDYDRLLWACDINFVRGEDSFVRAQWAAQPFIWHIYPQDDDVHHQKLHAFLQRYCAELTPELREKLEKMWLAWNRHADTGLQWDSFVGMLPELKCHAGKWSDQLAENGDLATNLVQFVKEIS